MLAKMLQNESNNNHDFWVNFCREGTTIHFLSFADDLIVFSKTNTNTRGKIKEILKNYGEFYGQTVKLNKYAFSNHYQCINARK